MLNSCPVSTATLICHRYLPQLVSPLNRGWHWDRLFKRVGGIRKATDLEAPERAAQLDSWTPVAFKVFLYVVRAPNAAPRPGQEVISRRG